MRILMATSEFPPVCGGIGWYVYYLCEELKAHGHEVTLVQRSSRPVGGYNNLQVHSISTGSVPLWNARRMVGEMRAFIQAHPHDLAIVHSTPLGAWIKDIPTLLVVHCCVAECEKSIYRGALDLKSLLHRAFGFVYREVERRSVLGADKVAVVSQAMKKEVIEHYAVKGHYVGNGVDTQVFTPSKDRRKRGVFLPSLLKAGKGVREAMRILGILRRRGCDIPFRMIDAGPMKAWLKKSITKNKFEGIEFFEPMDHSKLKHIYGTNSIVLLPSYYEGMPTIVLEAMASKIPVVASDAGGTAEAVLHGAAGYIHRISDVEGMAESILRLDADEKLRERLGNNGFERVHADYTWKTIGNNFNKLIESMA